MSTVRTINFEIGHKFGKENQIEVIEFYTKSENGRSRRNCKVNCSICEKDPELHGQAIYNMSVYDVKRNRQPCGCSYNPKWTEHQWTVILRRRSASLNYFFMGFDEPFKDQDTRVILFCPKHKKMWKPSIGNFTNGRGCPMCGADSKALKKTKPFDEMVKNFMKTGSFKEGTVFWKKDNRGRRWCYTCPICSEDEYVKSGVCSGIFESDKSNLLAAKLTCRCSYAHRWTTAEREYQIQKIIKENKLDISFVGWVSDGYNCQENRIILKDVFGTEYEKSISNFIDAGAWHLSARDNDPTRETYLYILEAKSRVSEFTGFGVTTKLYHRFKEHSNQLDKYGFYIDSIITFKTTWDVAFGVEQSILQKFPRNPQDVTGFKKEATFYEEFGDVVNFVEIALQQEGQRVELKDLLK